MTGTAPQQSLLTPSEAADYLRISTVTLRRLVDAGRLRYIAIGTSPKRPRRLYDVKDLDEFIAASRRRHDPSLPQIRQAGKRRGAAVVLFSDISHPR
ncbi:helix-turn-helix domain-containing protein [Breoghania sp.]|uniref:helix-turn-helix domain-containing protein n=1 Tax=Breoghania sp. TaxID=2065378 RepID=UPI002AABD095|nr:helix-turn-helix domain-containing protein [Breoghania sp.]